MKFRPQAISKKYKLTHRNIAQYNYVEWRHISQCMHKIFARLHYLGSHSYLTAKWHNIEQAFLKKHKNLDL
jgi:hypothetical protein